MKLTRIHQIEISSRCNLRCRYCPHPRLQRPKVDMGWSTFHAAMSWAMTLDGPELSFTGMGEALLHPQAADYLSRARAMMPDTRFLLATNGIALDEEKCLLLKRLDVEVFISTHRPEVAGPAVERAARHGLKGAINTQFVNSGFDWAGQVQWANLAPKSTCQYLAQGWGTVLVNGNIVNCCMDAHGLYPYGHVLTSKIEELDMKPIPLCEKCHLTVPI